MAERFLRGGMETRVCFLGMLFDKGVVERKAKASHLRLNNDKVGFSGEKNLRIVLSLMRPAVRGDKSCPYLSLHGRDRTISERFLKVLESLIGGIKMWNMHRAEAYTRLGSRPIFFSGLCSRTVVIQGAFY